MKTNNKKHPCCACNRNIPDKDYDDCYVCDGCGGSHHIRCSGDSGSGYGEYPAEGAYSYCKKCTKPKVSNLIDGVEYGVAFISSPSLKSMPAHGCVKGCILTVDRRKRRYVNVGGNLIAKWKLIKP